MVKAYKKKLILFMVFSAFVANRWYILTVKWVLSIYFSSIDSRDTAIMLHLVV